MQKYKEKKRERFLTEDEFRRLGQVLNEVEAEGSETFAAVTAIRLLMLTGCRLNEIQHPYAGRTSIWLSSLAS